MRAQRATTASLPMSIPATTFAEPKTQATALPSTAKQPLQVKDGFESAPATKADPVKTDALLGPKLDEKEVARLQRAVNDAPDLAARKTAIENLGSYVYGVPTSKINVITDFAKSEAGKINVILPNKDNKAGTTSGWTVPQGQSKGNTFEPGRDVKPTIVLNADVLLKKSGTRAQKVLFHEGLHLAHAKQTASVYADFQKTKTPKDDFDSWLKRQKMPAADKELVKSELAGGTSNTEAIAHTEAFIESFKKLDHHATKPERMVNEGAELLDLPGQSPGPAVAKREVEQMKKLYDSLDTNGKKALLDTLGDLPSNWLTSAQPFKSLIAENGKKQ